MPSDSGIEWILDCGATSKQLTLSSQQDEFFAGPFQGKLLFESNLLRDFAEINEGGGPGLVTQ